MKRGQRDVRISVFGLQFDGLLQCVFDLAAQALRQRFGHADALTITAQCIGLPVKSVGILGLAVLLRLGPLGHFHEQFQLGFFFSFEVIGVNAGGFVGHRQPCAASFETSNCCFFKFTVVKQHPSC